MNTFSTRQAAKKLGIDTSTLLRHIRLGKVQAPKSATSGGMTIHFWTEEEIEQVCQLLQKIANGRKTRYKKQSAVSSQLKQKEKPKARRAKARSNPTGSARSVAHRTRPDHSIA